MCVLDDVCATSHAVTEGLDEKLLQVCLKSLITNIIVDSVQKDMIVDVNSF